jgi:hypothetical protein
MHKRHFFFICRSAELNPAKYSCRLYTYAAYKTTDFKNDPAKEAASLNAQVILDHTRQIGASYAPCT